MWACKEEMECGRTRKRWNVGVELIVLNDIYTLLSGTLGKGGEITWIAVRTVCRGHGLIMDYYLQPFLGSIVKFPAWQSWCNCNSCLSCCLLLDSYPVAVAFGVFEISKVLDFGGQNYATTQYTLGVKDDRRDLTCDIGQ